MDIEAKIVEIIGKYSKDTGNMYSKLLSLENDYLSTRSERDMIDKIYDMVRGIEEWL